MNNRRNLFSKSAAVLFPLPLLAACVTMNPQPEVVKGDTPTVDGWLSVLVAPGGSASCNGTPCRIYYQTPNTGGEVEVVVNNRRVGRFPGGKSVSLGDYGNSVRITIADSDIPISYVNIPNDAK